LARFLSHGLPSEKSLPSLMSSATPSVEIFPGHRDRCSGDHDKLITIKSEPVINFRRNADHDQFGIAITIARNR
jgi:hypothetical protein